MGIIPACAGSTITRYDQTVERRDHPRMRGEHGGSKNGTVYQVGSSPHARGAQESIRPEAPQSGIIPACAGSTNSHRPTLRPGWDHPRMRGEHRAGYFAHSRDEGSSPHARGAPATSASEAKAAGIIPACAGSTSAYWTRRTWGWDHPRMRGEHKCATRGPSCIRGSSPHARGARVADGICRRGPGIIPACAGSTRTTSATTSTGRDHPRMRGEHAAVTFAVTHGGGSSPHARGAQVEDGGGGGAGGIIPACAGSTTPLSTPSCSPRDHPRMRGEHYAFLLVLVGELGSSPHARGALLETLPLVNLQGIIPACAGSTRTAGSRREEAWDHPRMRGEHGKHEPIVDEELGSSPHARGALSDLGEQQRHSGIIPACAGSTQGQSQQARPGGDHPRMRGEHR